MVERTEWQEKGRNSLGGVQMGCLTRTRSAGLSRGLLVAVRTAAAAVVGVVVEGTAVVVVAVAVAAAAAAAAVVVVGVAILLAVERVGTAPVVEPIQPVLPLAGLVVAKD